MADETVLTRGAEAVVSTSEFLGFASIVKTRHPKRYRNAGLDDKIRLTRMRNEAKLMIDARKAGVRTPVIYDIDPGTCSITMEKVEGMLAKNAIDDVTCDHALICEMIGKAIADLHNARICHGDLTTSNMIFTKDNKICILDISLGKYPADTEDMGVDIHLLERAFMSAHPKSTDEFNVIMDSYSKHSKDSRAILAKVEDIKKRGRYT